MMFSVWLRIQGMPMHMTKFFLKEPPVINARHVLLYVLNAFAPWTIAIHSTVSSIDNTQLCIPFSAKAKAGCDICTRLFVIILYYRHHVITIL